MKLLGAFFNIFLFYYFMAMCGSANGQGQGVETQSVQTRQSIDKPAAVPAIVKDSLEVDYLFRFTENPNPHFSAEG
ncbi:MAG: hypothetical protein KDD10_21405 [Phaeodactylibacter sp.]|nr:hypothetical protein [Phaeodactylibacter sp.]MCB9293673.1 hypothetical protein [Lewinellaceae bacterium]